ncbi:hypothetical protein GGS24DRAFT_496456 [Hypoxylon argillaceum]|nr:hypothetical protein GGS24DRAFT_496456 [Hypoxylon argillaceum]
MATCATYVHEAVERRPRYPMRSLTPHTSTGFALRTNLLDPTRDLTPTIQNLYLSDQRTGAGTALTPPRPSTPPLYPTEQPPSPPPPTAPQHPYPCAATPRRRSCSRRRGGRGGGSYAVCLRDVVFGGEEAAGLTARYVYGGESVPADCAPVEFVVECAVLPDLPAGSSWNHDSALEVACVA